MSINVTDITTIPPSKSSNFYDTRGWAFFFLDRLEEARQDAITALELDSEAYNARALLYRIE
ncbi:unnamed protein product, partial [marine sediment metagenome]